MNDRANLIQITVNGESRACPDATSVSGLLQMLGAAGKKVAVERNGAIVPRSEHAATRLAAGDRLEIVVAVGGG